MPSGTWMKKYLSFRRLLQLLYQSVLAELRYNCRQAAPQRRVLMPEEPPEGGLIAQNRHVL